MKQKGEVVEQKAVQAAMRIPPAPTIVTASDCSPSEKHAARELQEHLEKICGLRPEIKTDAEEVPGPKILVGASRYVKQLAPEVDCEKLGTDGFLVRTVSGNLILAGDRRRGGMYAVYDFLERRLGCRWFTADCAKIPRMAQIELPPLDEHIAPALEYREPYFTEAFDGLWSARNRMNSTSARLGEDLGRKITYAGFVHTFYGLVPPAKYFKDHPEYFSEIGGKRVCDHAQLCLTNPEVVKVVTEAVRERIRKNPNVDIVSVSQNDCRGYCTCPNCKALAEQEGSESGPLIHFVNKVADNIKDEFPRVAIDTLAYQYTRKPPRLVKPRPNVIVRLCSIECCFSHPLATCPENKSFVDDIVGWSKICNRLYIWDYVTDFAHYMMPFPNLRVIQPNIKFFVEHSVKGIFEEGAYPKGGGAESGWLRSYLMAKALWNPDCDPNAAVGEFLNAYYGPAAESVRKYYDLIHDRVEKDNIHVHIYDAPGKFFTADLVAQCEARLIEAQARAASDAAVARRLRQLRMWLDYAKISLSAVAYTRAGNRIVLSPATDDGEAVNRFLAAAKEFGVREIREGRPSDPADWANARLAGKKEYDILVLENPLQTVEVVPGVGGRMFRWLDKKSGQNVLRAVEKGNTVMLTEGGYEEYSERKYRTPGWNEDYAVVACDARAIQLQAALKNGLRFGRSYGIDADKAQVSISSNLENVGKAVKDAMLRAHPEFHLGKIEDCEFRWLNAEGKWTSKSLEKAKGIENEVEEYFRADTVPAGQWLVWNKVLKIGILGRFKPSQVGTAMLNRNYTEQRFALELWSPETKLAPGRSVALEHSFEIIHNNPGT